MRVDARRSRKRRILSLTRTACGSCGQVKMLQMASLEIEIRISTETVYFGRDRRHADGYADEC